MNDNSVSAVIVFLLVLVIAAAASAFSGWLLMLSLGAVLGTYGIAGPGFFVTWGLAAVIGIITGGSSTANRS